MEWMVMMRHRVQGLGCLLGWRALCPRCELLLAFNAVSASDCVQL